MPKAPEIQVQTFVAGPYSLTAAPVKKAPGTHFDVAIYYYNGSTDPHASTDPVTPAEIPGCESFSAYWVEGEIESRSMAVEVLDALKSKLAELFGKAPEQSNAE